MTLDHPHTDSFLALLFARVGLPAPESAVRTTSLGLLRSLVREQHFIGWLPLEWAKDDVEAGTLRIIDLPASRICRTFGIVMRSTGILNESAKALIHEIRTAEWASL